MSAKITTTSSWVPKEQRISDTHQRTYIQYPPTPSRSRALYQTESPQGTNSRASEEKEDIPPSSSQTCLTIEPRKIRGLSRARERVGKDEGDGKHGKPMKPETRGLGIGGWARCEQDDSGCGEGNKLMVGIGTWGGNSGKQNGIIAKCKCHC